MLTIAGLQVYVIITTQNLVRLLAIITALKIERLSMTFTANGKRQKSNFWCLILTVCTI